MSEIATPTPNASAAALNGWAKCDQLGVIQATGEEAAKFLHGQLTHDFVLLDESQARLASFCSPKGRMQASFIGFKRAEGDILLICSKDLLATTLKRLSMFVMRTKAKLRDASDDLSVWGLAGSAIDAALPSPVWSKVRNADGSDTLRLYSGNGVERALRVAPAETPAPQGTALPAGVWDWLEVMSGVAVVSQPLFEAFVPQMLNHESVGGVNFKKGCYPGQEVVARSQFRGTLKRRAYIVAGAEPMHVGQEVFKASDAEQPCGTVAAAAAAPDGSWNAIVSMQTSAADEGDLHAGSSSGAAIGLLPLPYPLLDDI